MNFIRIHLWPLLKKSAIDWNDDNPFQQSAALSYYAIFSIPGLLIIVIWISGFFFGEEAVSGEIVRQMSAYIGLESAQNIQEIVAKSRLNHSNLFMKIIGIGALVFGATTLFFQLQRSLNHVWDVETSANNNLKKLVTDRASSLGLIVVISFLLLVSLVVSAFISVLSNWIEINFGTYLIYLVRLVNFILSLGIITLLFAIIFKVLPDVRIAWKSVWVGAFVTSVLFSIGKTLLGFYFTIADPSSSFGAAGTIILVMLWINYSCLILFFGAEFTQAYAIKYRHRIAPSKHAKWKSDQPKKLSE